MAAQPRWLSADEQHVWRGYVTLRMLLADQLAHELAEQSGLTPSDYQVLVELSEAPGRQMRMTDLAERTLLSKSRLSHQITRMETAGLVRRADCATDRRGAFAVLTPHGWDTIVAAAPGHVESVRKHLFDLLSPEEAATLGRIADRVVSRLREVRSGPKAGGCERPDHSGVPADQTG